MFVTWGESLEIVNGVVYGSMNRFDTRWYLVAGILVPVKASRTSANSVQVGLATSRVGFKDFVVVYRE